MSGSPLIDAARVPGVLPLNMGWLADRRERIRRVEEDRQASGIATMAKAFAEALGGVLQAQSAQIQQSSQFLGTLQDLSARKAAQVMGSRGGRTTQERKKQRKRESAAAAECVLCVNPLNRGTTLQQIEIHRAHGVPQPPEPSPEPERGN
jgi:hypothetical protein